MILIEVNAIRRSGHHAFINWLISNIHNVPYTENLCKNKYNVILGNKKILWVNEGEWGVKQNIDFITERKDRMDIVIISYEQITKEINYDPNYSVLTKELKDKWGVVEHIQIPFVRDYYNNMASLLKINNKNKNPIPFKNSYPLYIKAYKGQLKHVIEGIRGVIYDKWVSEPEYALKVCLKILGKVNQYHPLSLGGTGSSFGKGKQDMGSLLNRYKTVKFPKWVMDKKQNDIELNKLIKQIGFEKHDIEIQEN